MAVGVLLEEWAEVVLGEKGHEVFVEGERRNSDNGEADMKKEKEEVEEEVDVDVIAEEAREERRRKRRKVKHESSEGNTDG